MAKQNKNVRLSRKEQETGFNKFNLDNIVPPKYQFLLSIGIVLVLFLIFFAPMYFGGKTFESGDIITSKSMQNYVKNHGDGYTLWNPYVFGGVPAYIFAIGYKWFNLIYVGIHALRSVFTAFFSVEYAMWTFYLFLLAITSYSFMKDKTGNTLVSLFTAIATAFSTGLIVFLYIGHVTKLSSLCMYPLVFLLLMKFQKKITLLNVVLLIIALQLLVQSWHVQIIFYTLFAVGIYFVYFFIRALVKKENELTKQLVKSVVIFGFAAVIALLIQADNFTQIYEYTPYSTRGTKSIVEEKTAPQDQTGSGFYDYATNWSFSPGEVLTFVVPSYYGFGWSVYNGPLTQNQDYRVNTYFGQMPSVDVAMYMGVIIFVLGLFAIFTQWKDPFVQFLTILTGISLLISFGRTFPPVYDLMYNYFPYFNKFRVPSMILVLVQLSFPVLAGMGVAKIISLRNEPNVKIEKAVRFIAIAFSVLFFLSLILGSSLREGFISRMLESGKNPQYLKSLSDYAADMYIGDIMFAFAIIALTFWVSYSYIKSKISKDILVLALILFALIDLWRIDKRGADFIQEANINDFFREPDYISVIKSQNDKEPFRILNIKQDGSYGSLQQNANYHAYFLIQDLYGYSGIKPRSYQDIMDVVGSPVNPILWRMLNTKYIITDKPIAYPGLREIPNTALNSSGGAKSVVYEFAGALPRAYFVNKIEKRTGLEILNAVKDNQFDPKETAFVENDLNQIGKIDSVDSTATAQVIEYKPEKITIEANASGRNFLFLGDTYYPNGWMANVDGKETEIFKVNHGFRGIIVPQGKHKIEFIFAPKSFTISKYLALSLSSLTILALVIGIFIQKKSKVIQTEEKKTIV